MVTRPPGPPVPTPAARTPRVVLGLLGATAATTLAASGMVLVLRQSVTVVERSAAPRLDEVVTVSCAGLTLLIVLWFLAMLLLSLVGHLPGLWGMRARRLADRLAPTPARRLAAVVAGAVAIGTLVPTDAGGGTPLPDPSFGVTVSAPVLRPTGSGPTSVVADSVAVAAPDPGFVPTRPTVRPQPDPRVLGSTRRGPRTDAGEVVVRRGDTLWDLTRRHLGSGATDAEVARAWPLWHATNRAVIGPDPDLILPGQVLRTPAPDAPPTPIPEDVR